MRAFSSSWAPAWLRWMMAVAAVLSGFAFLVVNYWIYTARWWFIETQGHVYTDPPTISRAISPDYIGEPFNFWITLSGVCLSISVALLACYYFSLRKHLVAPKFGVWLSLWVLIPIAILCQLLAAVGMYTLSAYRFPHFHDAHMLGSFTFFGFQALLIVVYSYFNHSLLRDPDNLTRLAAIGALAPRWVRFRRNFGVCSVAFALVYLGLFLAKGYSDDPTLYLAYVTAEPMVISGFLCALIFAHMDKFRRSPAIGLS